MSENLVVICPTGGCENAGVEIAVNPWDGSRVACGPCGVLLEEQAEWYEPPEPGELVDPVETAAQALARLTPEERAALIALLGGAQ